MSFTSVQWAHFYSTQLDIDSIPADKRAEASRLAKQGGGGKNGKGSSKGRGKGKGKGKGNTDWSKDGPRSKWQPKYENWSPNWGKGKGKGESRSDWSKEMGTTAPTSSSSAWASSPSFKDVGSKREEGREMRSQRNNVRRTTGFTHQQEIDNRIASIEFQLCTESVPLKEEKKLLAEIQALKKNRGKVDQMNTMEQNLSNFDPGMSMKEQKEAINADISQYRDEKKKIQEKMTELSKTRQAQLGPIEEIQNERNAIGEQLKKKIEERNALRDEYRSQEREYYAYQQELRKARQERIAQERAERQKEYDLRRKQREAEKLDEQPHVAEITLIEQTIKYCKGLIQTKAEVKTDDKKEVQHDLKQGEEVLLRKEDREEEFYFAPTKGKKSGKKNKGGSETKNTKITHNAETFRLFDQLKLDAPLSTDQVPALLEELEKQLGDFQAKVKEWEEKKEEMKNAILQGLTEIEEKKAAREEEDAKEAAAEGAAEEAKEEAKEDAEEESKDE